MQTNFNVFGFEISIKRPENYWIRVIADSDVNDVSEFSFHAATFTGALLRAWYYARRFAKAEQRSQTVIIYRLPRHFLDVERVAFISSISLQVKVSMFFK